MGGPILVLVALAGTEDATLSHRLARLFGTAHPARLVLVHVIDDAPRGLVARDEGTHRAPWPGASPAAVDERLIAAEEQGARTMLSVWVERISGTLPGVDIDRLVRRGRPEHVLVGLAGEIGADVVVLSPRPREGSTQPGPHSVGHVARFVIDHAPVPVLLLRHRP